MTNFLYLLADLLSTEVMNLMTNCAKYESKEIDIDDIDGGTSEVPVDCDEDYLIGMAYVAQCHTFSRFVDLEKYST